jgi:type I restriction enzyme S subunit
MNIENILTSMPDNWKSTDLGNLLSELTDYTANGSFASLKENVTYYTEPEYAVLVRTTDLKKKRFKPERFTDKKGYEFLSKSTLFGGEILMANVGSIGEVYLVPKYDQPMTLAPNMYLMKYKVNELDNQYAFHFMNSNIFLKQLFSKIASTTLKAINKSNFRAIKIPLPPLKEQEKIADILSTADEKIDAIEEQIHKAETLKKGLLQKLLSEGIGHSEFKDSELGKIPESWEVVTVENISKVIRGASPRPKGDPRYYGGTIPRLMGTDVTRDGKYVIPNKDFLTEEGAKKSRFLPKGTLTIVCSGTVGVPSILGVDCCIHDGFLALIDIKENIELDFLFHLFSSLQEKFDNSATHGGVFTNLTTSIIKEFLIQLPPLKEQKQIAEILSTADEKLEVLRAKKQKYETLKKGLLQKLLSGEVRV